MITPPKEGSDILNSWQRQDTLWSSLRRFPLNYTQAVRGQRRRERNVTAAGGEAQEMNYRRLYVCEKINSSDLR